VAATTSAPATTRNVESNIDKSSVSPDEQRFWDSIRNSENPQDFKSYLQKYPDGVFVESARANLARLQSPAKSASVPVVQPAVTPVAQITNYVPENGGTIRANNGAVADLARGRAEKVVEPGNAPSMPSSKNLNNNSNSNQQGFNIFGLWQEEDGPCPGTTFEISQSGAGSFAVNGRQNCGASQQAWVGQQPGIFATNTIGFIKYLSIGKVKVILTLNSDQYGQIEFLVNDKPGGRCKVKKIS
jgi:hypothetical protein